jgi:[ribosomal protein S5]-alanine N-acetyltransferase
MRNEPDGALAMARILETPRLAIDELDDSDAPFILRLLNEPSFIDNIADRGVRTLDQALGWLRDGPMASYARHGFGLWRIGLGSDGTAIGICGLIKRDALTDVDIGYALLPEYCGQGYALEAAAAVLAHGRDRFGLRRIVAIVSQGNTRSTRLLQKIGFADEGLVQLSAGDKPLLLFGLDTLGLS